MKNILSVYKFNFPFISPKNEKTKYKTVLEEIRKLLVYEKIFIWKEKYKRDGYEIVVFNFDKGYIKIIYNPNNSDYFLPTFNLELFYEDTLTKSFLEDFCYIFYSIDYQNYIFEFISEKIKITNSKIICIKDLYNSFKTYNYNKLDKLIKATDKDYLDDKLQENIVIRNAFLYMIFMCFVLYKNILIAKEEINWLKDFIWKKIDSVYISEMSLSKKRLESISDSSLNVFKKYKLFLDNLFMLFSEIIE